MGHVTPWRFNPFNSHLETGNSLLFDCKKIAHKIWTKLKKQNLLKNYSALGGQQEFLTIKSHGNVKRIGV